ncbi:MAG: ABC transporter permease [Tenuifilaceae bacterium]|jgi:putative ABC transport system permease protein|nr:ABC transporter permease [Bacteroidales bacterium]MDI9516919.1 ABC transporter permease [Bacteroidota bacterium]NLH56891.1 FtsX-like permease family protein [Rikenellaceae bacterium]OQC63150.1 MAG: Macrolide export ATP-binding/permease protein MacB [Bacteroidetes bacterium ADurb.Bin008]HNV81230.1 ABC transporter permease [Tenuifilaceae bacterium]
MYKRYIHDINIAIESILANKLKSMLTALGIIFGVAAVISMLAIGNGAQKEILDQIKMVGVNNIVINPIFEEADENSDSDNGERQSKKFSPGLTLLDVEAIQEIVPSVQRISPEVSLNSFVQFKANRMPAKIMGVSPDYFELFNLPLESGTFFTDFQVEHGITVCIIGANIKNKFFSTVNPIGQYIKFGNVWLQIIGVLQKTDITITGFESAGVNVYNDNVYIPIKTMLLRYQNRALVNLRKAQTSTIRFGGGAISFGGSPQSQSQQNYHQLDRIIVQVKETNEINSTTEVLSRMLLRRHAEVKDFEIVVPELLLKQQQRTKDIFNIVLGAIASISLIVGGIGIMNIMFASVMERIKEIGTRLAIGAKKADIIAQFLAEAVLISVSGGFIGVILGIILSFLITHFSGILTIVSPLSVLVAFGVSAAVGVIFGLSPAKRAAEKDPIESLRHE